MGKALMATTGDTPWEADVLDLLAEIGPPGIHVVGILRQEFGGSGRPATIRCRPECALRARTVATSDGRVGAQAGGAAFDVEELLGADVSAEAGFGDEEVAGVDPDGSPTTEELP